MLKKKILSTAICIGMLFLISQNCAAQTNTKEIKSQSQLTQNNDDMFTENVSKYNFDETVEKLTAECEKKKW
jgi:coenzyme F420-reducing hydrogenase beta subunit